MGRPKRLYPLGKYRLRTPKEVDKDKAYPVELEYTWNRFRLPISIFFNMRIDSCLFGQQTYGFISNIVPSALVSYPLFRERISR